MQLQEVNHHFVTLQQSHILTKNNMEYKSLVQVIKEHNVGKDLEEGLIPMYKKTKFEGKEFDRKKEIKSCKDMIKAIHKVAKMQDSMQYTAETGGSSAGGNPNKVWENLRDAERALYDYMGGIERGHYDGVIDMDRD